MKSKGSRTSASFLKKFARSIGLRLERVGVTPNRVWRIVSEQDGLTKAQFGTLQEVEGFLKGKRDEKVVASDNAGAGGLGVDAGGDTKVEQQDSQANSAE